LLLFKTLRTDIRNPAYLYFAAFLHATNGKNEASHIVHLTTGSFGLTLGFALYPAMCLQAKLWVLAGMMIPAVVCQAWAEITFAKRTDHEASIATL
jgi:hypothetical protein